MKKNLDPVLTRELQDWLNTPAAERDVLAGATLFLRLSRNRALYNSVLRRPDRYMAKLEYELRKYLRIRLDNMAAADIVRLEAEVMPRVAGTVEDTPELPEHRGDTEADARRGRRPDHASLPPEIRDLWDSNAGRYRRIVLLFNELKALSGAAPCDRYEKLKILADLDRTYRANLEAYDSYVAEATPPESGTAPDPSPSLLPDVAMSDSQEMPGVDSDGVPQVGTESAADVARRIGAARKSVSANKKQLAELPADDPRRAILLSRIQEAVGTVVSLGGGFAERQIDELAELGVTF